MKKKEKSPYELNSLQVLNKFLKQRNHIKTYHDRRYDNHSTDHSNQKQFCATKHVSVDQHTGSHSQANDSRNRKLRVVVIKILHYNPFHRDILVIIYHAIFAQKKEKSPCELNSLIIYEISNFVQKPSKLGIKPIVKTFKHNTPLIVPSLKALHILRKKNKSPCKTYAGSLLLLSILRILLVIITRRNMKNSTEEGYHGSNNTSHNIRIR
nr:MAG TPA: hypothetical protein [Caudoviricetes sp.]